MTFKETIIYYQVKTLKVEFQDQANTFFIYDENDIVT